MRLSNKEEKMNAEDWKKKYIKLEKQLKEIVKRVEILYK